MDRKSQRGHAMVEAALTLPIFLLLLMSILEVGRFFQVQQAVTNAAREGARTAILPLARSPGFTNTLPDASAVRATVSQFLQAASISGATVDVVSTAPATLVRVTLPYSPITGLAAFEGFRVNVTGEAVMRNETSR